MPMRREVPKEKVSDQTSSAHSPKDSCPFAKDLNIHRQSQPNEKQTRERPLSTLLKYSQTIPVPPTQTQIDIVRYTWERVTEIRHPTDDPLISPPHAFGFALYKALFDLDNDLRLVFPNVLQQARALAGMIAYIVRAPAVTFAEQNPLQCCAPTLEDSKHGAPLVCIHGNRRQQPTPTIQAINARKRANQSTVDNPSFSDVVQAAASSQAAGCGAQSRSSSSSTEPREDGIEQDSEWLGQRLRRLGARHAAYNVEPHHIAYMGPAVIRVLKERLQGEFLPEVEDAWQTTHAFAAHHMKIGLEAQKASEEDNQNHRQSRGSKNNNCSIQ